LRLVSRIVHDNVAYLEIRRGEGIDGGDLLVVGTESSSEDATYFFSTERVNRYRLRFRVSRIDLTVDEELEKLLAREGFSSAELRESIEREGRLALPSLEGGRYPRVELELVFEKGEGKLRIRVTKPS
jgi:hypothetical protein